MIPLALRYVLKGLVLPPGGPLAIALIGLLIWRRRPRLGFALCALGFLSLWAFVTPLVGDALARAVERYPALDPAHLTAQQSGAGAIVILGGGLRVDAPEYGGDAPGGATMPRLVEGARVARMTHLPVLVSGGGREAGAMRRFLEEDLNTPVRWVERASGDTHDNAVLSARILAREGIHHIILVTSSNHIARSVEEFRATGLEVTPAPAEMWTRDTEPFHRYVPSVEALERSYAACYELGGELVRRVVRGPP